MTGRVLVDHPRQGRWLRISIGRSQPRPLLREGNQQEAAIASAQSRQRSPQVRPRPRCQSPWTTPHDVRGSWLLAPAVVTAALRPTLLRSARALQLPRSQPDERPATRRRQWIPPRPRHSVPTHLTARADCGVESAPCRSALCQPACHSPPQATRARRRSLGRHCNR